MQRTETRVVKIGDKYIGGNNPILIQSMTNTKTKDVKATINQILQLEKYGCDIIRVAVLNMDASYYLSGFFNAKKENGNTEQIYVKDFFKKYEK